MTMTAVAQSPCDQAELLTAGETVSAEIVTLEVPEPSLVRLHWEMDAEAQSFACGGDHGGMVIEDHADGMMMAFSRAGSHTFRLIPAGVAHSLTAPRIRAHRFDVAARQDSYAVEMGDQWVEIIQTTFEGSKEPAMKDQVVTDPDPVTLPPAIGTIATHFELRDLVNHGVGPWLASLVISSRTELGTQEMAQRFGLNADESLTAFIERGIRFGKDQVVTDPDPEKDQVVTDPDPEKDQVVTDPDPEKDQVVTDPDPEVFAPSIAWRVDLAIKDDGQGTSHLDALAWLAPLVWPELSFEPNSESPAGHLLAWQAVR